MHAFTVASHNCSWDDVGYMPLNDDGLLNPLRFNQHDVRKVAFEDAAMHLRPDHHAPQSKEIKLHSVQQLVNITGTSTD
jgi:hypothetical protein